MWKQFDCHVVVIANARMQSSRIHGNHISLSGLVPEKNLKKVDGTLAHCAGKNGNLGVSSDSIPRPFDYRNDASNSVGQSFMAQSGRWDSMTSDSTSAKIATDLCVRSEIPGESLKE